MSLPLQTASLKPFRRHLVANSAAASSSRTRIRSPRRFPSSIRTPRRHSTHLVVAAASAAADPNPSSDLDASPAKPRGRRPKAKSEDGLEDFPAVIPRKTRRGRRSEAAAVEDFVRDRLERTFAAIREQSAGVLDGKEVLKDRMEVEEEEAAAAAEGEGFVEEEDSDWPLDADVGWGTRASDYFEKHPIKNVVEEGVEIDWEGEMEEGWVKEINCLEWESFAFHPSPLVVLVFERYRRATDNWKFLKELEKAAKVYWNAKDRLPPRTVKIDINIERDLAYALKVKDCPELLFLKGNKIIYREKEIRTSDELVQMIAHFYYNAKRPSWIDSTKVYIPTSPF